jgi:hypothetical protein
MCFTFLLFVIHPILRQGAFNIGQDVCLTLLTGVINHMAPAGEYSHTFTVALTVAVMTYC